METVLLSWIEHYSYCPRQCGLIVVESTFDENIYTIRGELAHQRVHSNIVRNERGRKILRGLPLWSESYGLSGVADVVEVESLRHEAPRYLPIEYKVGKDVGRPHALYQACAQAFCLEEMFGTVVDEAAVYYIGSKKRVRTPLDQEVRAQTLALVDQIRDILRTQRLPPPIADRRCWRCSLAESCQPQAVLAAQAHPSLFRPLSDRELP